MTLLTAFVVSVCAILMLRPLAIWVDLLDVPGGRKQHARSAPLVGGMAVFAGIVVALIYPRYQADVHLALLAGIALLIIVGVIDDFLDLKAMVKLCAQLTTAVVMIFFAGNTIEHLGNLFGMGTVTLGFFSAFFTVLCTVGMINAMNMSDGLDGLAGGLALIALFFFYLLACATNQAGMAHFISVSSAALAGFLVFNVRGPWRQRASVFLGDSGSTMLGFVLVWVAIALTQGEGSTVTPITVVWILAIPLLDMITMVIRRVRLGRNPFAADREHIHHILIAAGYPEHKAVGVIWAAALALGAVGTGGWYAGVPELVMAGGFVVVSALYYQLVTHAWKAMRYLKRNQQGKIGTTGVESHRS